MRFLAVLTLLGASALLADPITVFSNFGPGQSYGGSPFNVTGASALMGYEAVAVPFTPSASVVLSQVDVAFEMLDPLMGGGASFTLQILADNGNQPGAILADLGGLSALSSASVLTAHCSSCPNLVTGTQYWLAALPGEALTGTGWDTNDQNVTGRVAFLMPEYFESWLVQTGWTQPAFDVVGDPVGSTVPEPATGWLLAPIVAAIYIVRRKCTAVTGE
jgi:hypothetical protein